MFWSKLKKVYGRLESRLFVFGHWIRGPMTGGAILWCWLVEQNGLGCHHLRQLVALGTADILMSTTQGKCSSLLMVEE